MNLKKTLKWLMPFCLALGCIVMFDSCEDDLCESKDCGEHGVDCDADTGACICEFGWYSDGGNCNKFDACVANGTVCDADNTTCDNVTGECICEEGWFGNDCDSNDPCTDAAACPENSTCVSIPAEDADGNTLFYANGDTARIDACECLPGFELNEEATGCVSSIGLASFLGVYTQNDQDCESGEDFPAVATGIIVADPEVENGIVLQGFAGLNGGVGHNVKAVVNEDSFNFSPTIQTLTNNGVEGTIEATFESLTSGSYNVGALTGEVTVSIQYRLTSGTTDECFAVLVKQ